MAFVNPTTRVLNGYNNPTLPSSMLSRTGYATTDSTTTSPAYNVGAPNFNTYMQQNGVPSFESTQNRYNELAGQADNLFSSRQYLNEVSGLKNMLMAQGVNAANVAGMQYANSARRAGTSGQGAGVARALSLIPAQTEARRLGLAGEEFRSRQDAQRASYMANLQSELANNQQAYRQMLASYNANMFGVQNQSAQWRAQLTEDQRQFDATHPNSNSGGSGSNTSGLGGGSVSYSGNFTPGYVGTTGFTPDMINGNPVFNSYDNKPQMTVGGSQSLFGYSPTNLASIRASQQDKSILSGTMPLSFGAS